MARKRKEETEAVAEAVNPVQELDTLPGETFGLAISSPPEISANEPDNEPDNEPEAEADEGVEPQVSANIPSDPRVSVAAALVATGRLYNEAGTVSTAYSEHLRTTAGEPELHAFLMRMQTLLGEFRHSFEQIEHGISDRLSDAIKDALAA